MDIALCMNKLLPNAQWVCREDTYETLEMLDKTPKPSIKDIEDIWLLIQKEKKAEIEKQEASKARDEAMLKGFVYNGMDISVTKDDGDGMVQVKDSFEYDPTPTVIYFKNGTRLPMTIEEFAVFAPIFRSERKKFFS